MTACSGRGLILREWRPMARNTLIGFADISLPIGLEIDDVAVHVSHGRAWVSFPGRPVLDADGQHVGTGGKKRWAISLRWSDRAIAARFSEVVIELVRAIDPDALADVGGSQ